MVDLHFPSLVRYRFEAEALAPISLPAYPGSVWRGLLGSSLRRTACVSSQSACSGCLLQRACPYFVFFKTAEDESGHGTDTSHPFVLDAFTGGSTSVAPGEPLGVGMTLIGDANRYLPHLVHAMNSAGASGIGRGRGRYRLVRVLQEATLSRADWNPIYTEGDRVLSPFEPGPVPLPDCPTEARVQLVTPLRIKRRGRFVGPREFVAADFLRNLCRRLDRLAEEFGGIEGRFYRLHREGLARLPPGEADVRWLDWTRYSARQGTRMQLGGLVGTLTLPQAAVVDMWPLLWLGQWVHVGKATTFGLGAYRLFSET